MITSGLVSIITGEYSSDNSEASNSMMLSIVFYVILFFCSYTAFSLLPNVFYWKKRGVDHISLFTALWRIIFMKESWTETIRRDYDRFADKRYFGGYLSIYPALFVKDLDLIKQMFVKDFDHFTDRFDVLNAGSDPLLKKNLLAAKGKEWKELRTTISPVFSSAKMKNMFFLIAETAKRFVDHFDTMDQNNCELEMKDVFSKYTNDIIVSCAFGTPCDSLKEPNNEIYSAGLAISKTPPYKAFRMLFMTLFPKLNKYFKIQEFPRELTATFKKTIRNTMYLREKEGIIRPDLVHLLMEAKKGKLQQETAPQTEVTGFATVSESKDLNSNTTLEITDDVIIAQSIIFFMAAFETSSSVLSFLSYELATHPEIQQRLVKEVDEHLPSSDAITFETITKMKYLDQVVTEALRKWPSAVVLFRKCTKEYTIQPKLKGEVPLTLKRGNILIIPSTGTQYDTKYFENPEEFNPERFSDENKKNVVPGSIISFGIGPRNCIGSRFALLEIKCLVATILTKFEIHLTEKTTIPVKLGKTYILSIDGPMILALKKRRK